MSGHGMRSGAERLAYMANQIARHLAVEGPDQAAQSTADHITKFWEARMIARLFAALETSDMGLDDITRAAFDILRKRAAEREASAA